MKHPLIVGVLTLMAATFAGSLPAQAAEPFDPDTANNVVNVYDTVVSYPVPSWQRSVNVKDEHRFSRKQKGPIFLLEQIPKDETFQTWTRLQAIMGLYTGANASIGANRLKEDALMTFKNNCARGRFNYQDVPTQPNHLSIVIFCEDVRPDATQQALPNGYTNGMGEIALMTFAKHKNTVVKVYHEWRGSRFQLRRKSSWPVKEAVLMDMIRRYGNIRLSPAR